MMKKLKGFIRATFARKSGAGFTIIELLVVVAIVAVLAAIVLANINSYNNRSKNAAIKANMDSLFKNGVVDFDVNGSYADVQGGGSFCSKYFTAGAPIGDAILKANGGSLIFCFYNFGSTQWCACSSMNVTPTEPANSTYCVDYTGYKRITQNQCNLRCGPPGWPNGGFCSD